jgi:hypothetical protein
VSGTLLGHDLLYVKWMRTVYLYIPGTKSVTVSSTPYSSGRVTVFLYSFISDPKMDGCDDSFHEESY